MFEWLVFLSWLTKFERTSSNNLDAFGASSRSFICGFSGSRRIFFWAAFTAAFIVCFAVSFLELSFFSGSLGSFNSLFSFAWSLMSFVSFGFGLFWWIWPMPLCKWPFSLFFVFFIRNYFFKIQPFLYINILTWFFFHFFLTN